MSLNRLVLRHLVSHPVRSLLTFGAVTVAIFLFCFLRSIVTTLDAAVKGSATNRVIVTSAVSLFQSLPVSYREVVEAVDGVESVSRHTWFNGYYKEEDDLFAQFATDARTVLSQYPEVILPEEQKQAFFEDRQGAIIGRELAQKFGWKIGDTVPLKGTIYDRVDQSEWTFNIRGIYESIAPNVDELTMFFHFEYLDEARRRGEVVGPDGTSVLLVKLKPGADPARVSADIDAHYAQGPQRTRTETESAFQAAFLTMLGNVPTFIGLIGTAVLVALLFGVVNTMTLAARERVRTTGILKALGFPNRVPARLYLVESALLVGSGGLAGILLSSLMVEPFRRKIGSQIPNYAVHPETMILAGIVCVVIALLAGGVPAIAALRLRPAESLRRGG